MPRPRASRPDRFDLYERCVQSPGATVRFLEAIHAGSPRVLREDFSGGAALCVAWARLGKDRRAVAVDLDPVPLGRVRGVERVRAVLADVREAASGADILAALNFPIGYWHSRRDLLAYLRLCKRRLRPGGVFVADIYGGRDAMAQRTITADLEMPDGTPVRYEWEQRDADPVTARVLNVIHFRVGRGPNARTLRNAFTYDWRLWSIPELVDACREAGFARVDVYDTQGGAIDHLGRLHVRPASRDHPLDDNFVVYIAARADQLGRPRPARGARRSTS